MTPGPASSGFFFTGASNGMALYEFYEGSQDTETIPRSSTDALVAPCPKCIVGGIVRQVNKGEILITTTDKQPVLLLHLAYDGEGPCTSVWKHQVV